MSDHMSVELVGTFSHEDCQDCLDRRSHSVKCPCPGCHAHLWITFSCLSECGDCGIEWAELCDIPGDTHNGECPDTKCHGVTHHKAMIPTDSYRRQTCLACGTPACDLYGGA